MGGVFLLIGLVQLILGLVCGMLLIKWIPLSYPFSLTELFVKFVLNPLEFFAFSMALIFGGIIHGNLLKYVLTITPTSLRIRSNWNLRFLIFLGMLINFFLLFNIAFWLSAFLLCFSIVYGMLSLVFQE